MPFVKNGCQAARAYSGVGRISEGYAISFIFFGQFQRLRCIVYVPSDLFALVSVMETRADHLSLLLMVTPRVWEAINQPIRTLHHRRHIFSGMDCSYVKIKVIIIIIYYNYFSIMRAVHT